MGYDMSHRTVPEAVQEAAKVSGAKFWEAVKHRDSFPQGSAEHIAAQVAVESTADARDKANDSEFRLNIWGMGPYRDAMDELAMAHESSSHDVPDWPDYPENDEDEDSPAHKAYEAKALIVQGHHHKTNDPTIPLHKFCSNDGWWVTASEAAAAIEAWETRDPDATYSPGVTETIASEYWGEWITYLRNAIDRDGFQVH